MDWWQIIQHQRKPDPWALVEIRFKQWSERDRQAIHKWLKARGVEFARISDHEGTEQTRQYMTRPLDYIIETPRGFGLIAQVPNNDDELVEFRMRFC